MNEELRTKIDRRIKNHELGDIPMLCLSIIGHKSLVIGLILFLVLRSSFLSAQIQKDSELIIAWADELTVVRGYINKADTTAVDQGSNRASLGELEYGQGPADGRTISLGDGGMATYKLASPLSDAIGPDFAVFENGFKEMVPPNLWFLELAVVEVSSDGVNFVRFPAISKTQTNSQVTTFGQLEPDSLHNLAGKYPLFYGTPFDLYELRDSSAVDIQNISHIRIMDIVGSLNENFGTKDSRGNMINDPFPTPFWSGGFDLDALAILGERTSSLPTVKGNLKFHMYPNPLSINGDLNLIFDEEPERCVYISIINSLGQVIYKNNKLTSRYLSINRSERIFNKGLFFICLTTETKTKVQRLIVQ